MDPLSQAAFGAAAAQACSRKKYYALAITMGALGGLAPDLDVLIRSDTNPLMGILYHRHFTHSLAFIPVGAFLVAAGVWLLTHLWQKMFKISDRNIPPFKRMYLFSLIGYATHGFVDALTSYGTVLFWPFTDMRISWDWVSIIDPLVTFPLMIGIWLSYRRMKPAPLMVSIAFVGAYIGFLAMWHSRAETLYAEELQKNNVVVENLRVMPLLFKPLHYRAVFKSPELNEIVIANISTKLTGEVDITPAGTVPYISAETLLSQYPELKDSIHTYAWFTDDFMGVYSEEPLVIGDYRYGSFDTPLKPLWAIEVDKATRAISRISMRR